MIRLAQRGTKTTSYQFITNFETGDSVKNTLLAASTLRKKGRELHKQNFVYTLVSVAQMD